jgi:hypothetical protein
MSNEDQCGECGQDIPVEPPKSYYRQGIEVYAVRALGDEPEFVCSCDNAETTDHIVRCLMKEVEGG